MGAISKRAMTEPRVHRFHMPLADFDATLLCTNVDDRDSIEFRGAVQSYFESQFKSFGGWHKVVVTARDIEVEWTPTGPSPDALEQILDKLRTGDYDAGITLLRLLLPDRPTDVTVLLNLGMALSDTRKLDEAERMLRRALQYEPSASNIWVALGVALVRGEKLNEALEAFERAIETDPSNFYAVRNYAATLGKAGRLDESLEAFQKAVKLSPQDQSAWLGLAEAFEALDQRDDAELALRRVLQIDEHSPVADAARNLLNEFAYSAFRANPTPERLDAVYYCLGALERFTGMDRQQVERVAMEVALLGMKGLDVNSSEKKYTLTSLPGSFSGLHLVCLMYVGFKVARPELDAGFDVSKEYQQAKRMFEEQNRKPH